MPSSPSGSSTAVGKSRLVDQFVQDADTQGWLVLDSAALSYSQATPYFPVRDLLRCYCLRLGGAKPPPLQSVRFLIMAEGV
jgi:hypothetical protein